MTTFTIRLTTSLSLALSLIGSARADEAPKFPTEDQVLADLDAKCSYQKLNLSEAVKKVAYDYVEMSKWQLENTPDSKPGFSADVGVIAYHKEKCVLGYLIEKLGEATNAKVLAANKSNTGSVAHVLSELRDKLEVEVINTESMDCRKDRWNFDSKERCVNKIFLPYIDHHILAVTLDSLMSNADNSEKGLGEFREAELDRLRGAIKQYRGKPDKQEVYPYGYGTGVYSPPVNMNYNTAPTTAQ